MSTFGLWLVILTVLAHVVLLVDDGHRWVTGRTTYTQWAGQKPYRKYLLVAGSALLPVGTFLHLFF